MGEEQGMISSLESGSGTTPSPSPKYMTSSSPRKMPHSGDFNNWKKEVFKSLKCITSKKNKFLTKMLISTEWIFTKGSVSVILIHPPSKDGNYRFATVPLKPLFDQ